MLDPTALEAAAREVMVSILGYSQGGWQFDDARFTSARSSSEDHARNVVTAYLAALPESEDVVERVARAMHAEYEARAAEFGYATRQDTREFDVDSPNGRLMLVAVAAGLRALSEGEEAP